MSALRAAGASRRYAERSPASGARLAASFLCLNMVMSERPSTRRPALVSPNHLPMRHGWRSSCCICILSERRSLACGPSARPFHHPHVSPQIALVPHLAVYPTGASSLYLSFMRGRSPFYIYLKRGGRCHTCWYGPAYTRPVLANNHLRMSARTTAMAFSRRQRPSFDELLEKPIPHCVHSHPTRLWLFPSSMPGSAE